MYSIEVQGLDQMLKRFQDSEKALKKVLERSMQQSLVMVTNMAKNNSPYQTGRLRRSIHPTYKNVLEGLVSTATGYAKAVEVGTRAHAIVPKKAKVLAFKVGGKMVFARRVWHPGTKGQFYMKTTSMHAAPRVKQIYEMNAGKFAEYLLSGKGL